MKKIDNNEKLFIKIVKRCDKCEMLNMYAGTYMWCDEYNMLCVGVKNCTGKNGKVRPKW